MLLQGSWQAQVVRQPTIRLCDSLFLFLVVVCAADVVSASVQCLESVAKQQ